MCSIVLALYWEKFCVMSSIFYGLYWDVLRFSLAIWEQFCKISFMSSGLYWKHVCVMSPIISCLYWEKFCKMFSIVSGLHLGSFVWCLPSFLGCTGGSREESPPSVGFIGWSPVGRAAHCYCCRWRVRLLVSLILAQNTELIVAGSVWRNSTLLGFPRWQ